MQVEFTDSIEAVDRDAWNALTGAQHPFLRHEFLGAMESTGCVGAGTGWHIRHAIINDNGALIAGLPLYEKTDSWGEFVFDFSWANAYHESGLHYYPKLVSAVPYTPATGPRLLTSTDYDREVITGKLVEAIRNTAAERGISSWHVLFPDEQDKTLLAGQQMLLRKDCQFHWRNRGYSTFDDFLGELRSAKRKKLRRERRRIREAGITFECLDGSAMSPERWQEIMPLYASSFLRRGKPPYLNQEFFEKISRQLPEHVLVIIASYQQEAIACAICFRSNDTLYGRYWGAAARYHSLHFETCYYQGIDYCIDNGLKCFEPGTQGEHKIARGFEPAETWSAHWLSHPQFADAVDNFLDRERSYTDNYMDAVRDHVPYRRDGDQNSGHDSE